MNRFVDPETDRGQRLIATLDIINQRCGHGTLQSAAEGQSLADEAAAAIAALFNRQAEAG